MANRVAVFIDYQNCYKSARRAFVPNGTADASEGQVLPQRLGIVLRDHADGERELVAVRIYRGMPSSRHDPKGQGAADRQVASWTAQALVTPVTRPLNYRDPSDPKEKGIDVRLALDMVMMAMRNEYDIAVLVSEDNDLAPALESVAAILGSDAACEVMTWVPKDGSSATPLRVPGHGFLIHRLTHVDYGHVWDSTDYTRRPPRTTRK